MKNRIARRLIATIVVSAMMLMLFAGCGSMKEPENDIQDELETTENMSETPETDEGTASSSLTSEEKDAYTAASSVPEAEWKAAYLEYLKNDYLNYEGIKEFFEYNECTYDEALSGGFIYVDDDDIPEMVLKSGTGSNIIVSYFNGEVRNFSEPYNTYYAIGIESYMEGSGQFLYTDGGESAWETCIVRLSDKGFDVLHNGGWADGGSSTDFYYDGEDNLSESDFNERLDSDYDRSKAKSAYGDMNYSQIIVYLSPDTTTEEPAAGSDADWKQAYKDTINESNYNAGSDYWALIYLDSDDIPELVWVLDSCNCCFYTFHNDKAVELLSGQSLGSYSSWFILGEGLINSCTPAIEQVYKLSNGNLSMIFDGYVSNEEQYDEDGNPYYPTIYYIDNQEVTGEQYSSAFGACFDRNKEMCVVNPKNYNSKYSSTEICGMTYSEIINALSE